MEMDDYALAGRNIGFAFGTGTILASWVTANTIMAAPQAAYEMGFLGAIGYGLTGIVAMVVFGLLAKRIQTILPTGVTVGDFFYEKYDMKNYILFLVMFFTLILINGAQLPIGMGTILESMFGIDYHIGVLITVIPILLFTTAGGMRAVVGTDFIMAVIILVGFVIIVPLTIFKMPIGEVVSQLEIKNPETLRLDNPSGLLWLIAGPLIGVGQVLMYMDFWQRAYAIRRNVITKTFTISGIAWMAIPLITAYFAYVSLAADLPVNNPNEVIPVAFDYLLPGVGVILFAIIIYSGVASTLSTRINGMATMFVNDIYRRFIRPNATETEVVLIARLGTLIYGFICIWVSWAQPSMFDIIVVLGTINASYIAPIILGLFWDKCKGMAAFVGTLLGSAFGIYTTLGPFFGIWDSPNLPINTEYMGVIISFLISLALTVGLSVISRKKTVHGSR